MGCNGGRGCSRSMRKSWESIKRLWKIDWVQFWAGHSTMVTPQPKCFTPCTMSKIPETLGAVSFVGCLGRGYVLLNHLHHPPKRTMQSNPLKPRHLVLVPETTSLCNLYPSCGNGENGVGYRQTRERKEYEKVIYTSTVLQAHEPHVYLHC